MKKKYDAMIFDLDGTLIDSKRDISVATNETIVQMGGKRLPEELIATFVGRGVRELIRDALKGSHGAQDEDAALKFFKAYYLAHCLDHTKLIDSALETLQELSLRGIKMAVFTNKPQIYTDKILQGFGLTAFFAVMLGSESGYPNKPARAGSDAIIAELHTQPEKTLMVGDSIIDLQTAGNAGMDSALSLNGFSSREEILALKGRATHLYEAMPFLLELT